MQAVEESTKAWLEHAHLKSVREHPVELRLLVKQVSYSQIHQLQVQEYLETNYRNTHAARWEGTKVLGGGNSGKASSDNDGGVLHFR
jgi:hypothetical protein